MFDKPGIKFTSDSYIKVIIAFDWNDPNPLDSSFLETDYEMSILKIDDDGFNNLEKFGFTDAIEQIDMTMYEKSFSKGDIQIKLNIPKDDFIYLQIFIIPDINAKKLTCGGKLINVTEFDKRNIDKSLVSLCESSS